MKQNQFHAIFPLCVCMLSLFSRAQLFELLLTVAHQTPLSLGFSRQEYWSGLPFPPLRDFPDPGIKPATPAAPGRQILLPLSYLGSPINKDIMRGNKNIRCECVCVSKEGRISN